MSWLSLGSADQEKEERELRQSPARCQRAADLLSTVSLSFHHRQNAIYRRSV